MNNNDSGVQQICATEITLDALKKEPVLDEDRGKVGRCFPPKFSLPAIDRDTPRESIVLDGDRGKIERYFPPKISLPARKTFYGEDTASLPIVLQNAEAYKLASVQAMRAPVLQKKSVARRIVLTVQLLGICLLFLSAVVAAVIYLWQYPIYCIEALIVLGVVCSHLVSLSIKSLYRKRQQESEKAARKQKMAHLFLIKEDTTTYLRALSKKDMKKGVHM